MLKASMDYITGQIIKSDVDLTWDQIYAAIDAILAEEKLSLRSPKFPPERRDRSESSKVTVEILPHGARRITMNWNYAE